MLHKINKQFKKDSRWNILFFLIPFTLFFTYKIYHHSFVEQGNYTIGYIHKIYWPVISHKTIMYNYSVKNIKYDGTDIYNSSKNPLENKMYLVRFSIKDPKESDIFQDIPVPDSIKSAPSNGWKELPEWAKKTR